MTVTLGSRYAGVLVGAACGDALGGTLEFKTREEIAQRYPHGFRDIVGGGWLALRPGETTDDTAMMLAVARACTASGIDLDAVAAHFVAWMETDPKDIGGQTRQALSLLAGGARWDEAGEQLQRASVHGVAGNGSLMRCAPVALRFRSLPHRMVRAAIDTSRITHADPRACWSTVALCQAIAHLLEGGSRETLLDAACEGIEDERVIAAIQDASTLPYEQVRSGGYVLETLTAALWAVLHASSAEDAVVRAVTMGGDADTTGTVAGALAGAAWGLDAISARWREVVEHRDELELLANQLREWDERDRAGA